MQRGLSLPTLSHLVGAIYDSALDPASWPGTLTDIRLELDFASAGMALVEYPSGDVPLHIMVGPEPYWMERSASYGADVVDLWGGAEKMWAFPLHEPVVLSRIRERSEWTNNRYYKEWAEPQGLRDVLAIALVLEPSGFGSVAFGRHDSKGAIGELEIEAASLLLPHLQRAVAIGRLLDIKSVVSSTFDAMLDTLGVAVVLVDAGLRIVHTNAAARAMLSAGGSIRSRRGVLSVHPFAIEAALAVAVREAAESEATMGRRGFGIPAAGTGGRDAVIHVLPLRHGTLRPGLMPDAVAAVFIAAASEAARVPADALSALYDLTPAEVRVFGEIAAGKTRVEAALALGIEATTVKAHLSQIFLKTDTGRQADLVALNAAIALPLRE